MRFFLIIVYFYNDYKVSTLSGKTRVYRDILWVNLSILPLFLL